MSSGSEDQPGPGQPGQGQPGQGQPGQGQPGQQPGWPPQPPPGPYAQPGAGWQPPPYGPPGPYPQGTGWPQAPRRGTNSLAIAALACAIGQVIAGPFAGIAAIVLGVMSLRQIETSGEDGRGMAITGLVLGIIGLIIAVILVIFIVALFHGVATNFNNPNGFPSGFPNG
jgi:Domain of unknown function (DUF4190)